MKGQRWGIVALLLLLAACSSGPGARTTAGGAHLATGTGQGGRPAHCPEGSPYAAAQEDPSTRGNYTAGGLYKPGVKDSTPTYVPDVACIPEPEVRAEARSPVGNRSPYSVLGKTYKVLDDPDGYVEKGLASYYGAKFHGRLTSNREVYDMYAFSAAHKSLPLPSFARVTNLDNGKSVIVRVNDRGPFHDGRVIDLSYAAATRLDIIAKGTGRVEVRALTPGKSERSKRQRKDVAMVSESVARTVAQTVAAPAAAAPVEVLAEALPEGVQHMNAVVGGVQLQVASFASQDNAQRALQRLQAAGIAGGVLQEALADGRPMWRLRINVADRHNASALIPHIAALGLGQARIISE